MSTPSQAAVVPAPIKIQPIDIPSVRETVARMRWPEVDAASVQLSTTFDVQTVSQRLPEARGIIRYTSANNAEYEHNKGVVLRHLIEAATDRGLDYTLVQYVVEELCRNVWKYSLDPSKETTIAYDFDAPIPFVRVLNRRSVVFDPLRYVDLTLEQIGDMFADGSAGQENHVGVKIVLGYSGLTTYRWGHSDGTVVKSSVFAFDAGGDFEYRHYSERFSNGKSGVPFSIRDADRPSDLDAKGAAATLLVDVYIPKRHVRGIPDLLERWAAQIAKA